MSVATKSSAEKVIRIVLADVTGLLADLVRDVINTQSDMQIMREVVRQQHGDLVPVEKDIDVVLTSISGNHLSSAYQSLPFMFPGLALIAISADGNRVEVYKQKLVCEVGREQLVEIIREVTRVRGVSQA